MLLLEPRLWRRSASSALGSMLGMGFAAELLLRVAAAKRAFFELGSCWSKPGIPMRWRRCVLLCRVVNAALSGVECCCRARGR